MIYYRHPVCNRLKRKWAQTQNPFTFKHIKNQRAQQRHNKSFATTVALLWILKQQMKQRWKRGRTVCYKPRNLKHRGITRNQRMAEDYTVGSLALPSIDTKMAKTPTYTQTNNSGRTKKVHWRLCVCMASDNTELWSLDGRATHGRRDQYPDSLFGEVDALLIRYKTSPLWQRRCLTTTNRFNNCFMGIEDDLSNSAPWYMEDLSRCHLE